MKKHIKSKKHRGGWFKKGITIKGIPFLKSTLVCSMVELVIE